MLRDLLYNVANRGTGRAAALQIPTFGKTGTTQDYRDALFIGFAGDLVVGVWIGNDDNSPLPRVTGGSVPARIWRNFMTAALNTRPAGPAAPVAAPTQNVVEMAPPVDPLAPVDGNQLAPTEPVPGEPLDVAPFPEEPEPVQPEDTAPPPNQPSREPERQRTTPPPDRQRPAPPPEQPRD
jgi:penicillin-binding protein 1A